MELPPSGGDPGLFALLYQCKDDLEKAYKRLESLEREQVAGKVQAARDTGRLEQESRHTQDLMESLAERTRGMEQAHSALAAKHEVAQNRVGHLDRELHGQVVRLQTIGAAIGGFLTIAQAIQFLSSLP